MLAAAGVASRRAAEQLIFQGCVSVNGKQVLLPQTPVQPASDQVSCLPGTCSLRTGRCDSAHVCRLW